MWIWTLAEYHGWPADGSIGKPVPAMVERVKQWNADGKEVRIFTARVWPLGTNFASQSDPTWAPRTNDALDQLAKILLWCREHLGFEPAVTCSKDYGMIELWDDRAVQVEMNTGRTIAERSAAEGSHR